MVKGWLTNPSLWFTFFVYHIIIIVPQWLVMRPVGKNKKSNIDVGVGRLKEALFIMVCCKKHPLVWKCLNNFVCWLWNFSNILKNFDPNGSFICLKFAALCKNTWTLRFKSQLTFASFAAVNHFSGPLRKQTFTSTSSKGHRLWIVTVGFRFILCVSVFQDSLLLIIIMVDIRKNASWLFKVQNLHVIEKCCLLCRKNLSFRDVFKN